MDETATDAEHLTAEHMTIERGERIGATAPLRPGACAVIRNADRILLTRRSDNGEWCLPGGGVEPGERPAETAIRETLEETGLTIAITALLGVFCDPDLVVRYPDGNRAQIYAACFEAEVVAGEPTTSDEVIDLGWFTATEASALTIVATQRAMLDAAFTGSPSGYFDRPQPLGGEADQQVSPRGGLFAGRRPVAERVDEHLDGFGER